MYETPVILYRDSAMYSAGDSARDSVQGFSQAMYETPVLLQTGQINLLVRMTDGKPLFK